MTPFPIVLILVLLVADGGFGLSGALHLAGWKVFALAWVPVLLVLAVTAAGMRLCRRRLAAGRGPAAAVRAERMARTARLVLLAHFAAVVLVFGWLDTVRGAVGDGVLVDELLTIAPPLVGVLAIWWVYYPIERRVRDAQLLRRLDLGGAVFPTPTRGQYVLNQARLHLLLLLVPIMMIITAAELIALAVTRWEVAPWAGDALTLAAAASIVVLSPLPARLVLDVQPMADSPLRDELLNVCRRHKVTIRGVLVWDTQGAMINAAVMGLVGRLRYVLLTDALLESMSRPQVEAVMAHEIGHIRKRHMPWLLACLLATIVVVTMPLVLLPSIAAAGEPSGPWARVAATAAVVVAGFVVLSLFGWVSRRFERQADTFAVRHLSNGGTITAGAAAVMSGALETIARLNAVPPDRRSWRHGSIAWRRAHLQSLVGRPDGALPIDRQVRWIKCLAAAVLGLVIVYSAFEAARSVDGDPLVWDDSSPCCASRKCTAPATTSSASTASPSPGFAAAATWTSWPSPCRAVTPGSAPTA